MKIVARPKKQLNLFEYLDYREYLKDFYAHAKSQGRGFSLRAFSKRAGFGSSNLLKLVMEGERNLTDESIAKFAKGLGLNKQELEFFRNLVHFNQSQDHAEKNARYQKLLQSKNYSRLKPMEKEQYEFYSTWYHAVVRELITSASCGGSLEKIAEKISPRVSLREVEQSVALLERLRFIQKDENGVWKAADPIVTTGEECASLILMNYHKSLLELTGRKLETVAAGSRDVSALTIGLKKDFLPELKKRIQEFRQEILKMVSTQNDAEEVVILSMQLMPATAGAER